MGEVAEFGAGICRKQKYGFIITEAFAAYAQQAGPTARLYRA